MRIDLPEPCLVVLIGASRLRQEHVRRAALPADRGASRRTSAAALVADDENDQAATEDAFAVLHFIAGRRLRARAAHRRRRHQRAARGARSRWSSSRASTTCSPVAIVLDLPEEVCQERNRGRPDRDFGAARRPPPALAAARARCSGLQREGFRHVVRPDARRGGRGAPRSTRAPLWTDRRAEHGPVRHHRRRPRLPRRAGRAARASSATRSTATARRRRRPTGRRAVFVGDLVDRGPAHADVLRLVMRHGRRRARRSACPATTTSSSCASSTGRDVQITHGLGRVARAARAASRRSSATQVARVPRRARQPRRARRRQARRRPRRA